MDQMHDIRPIPFAWDGLGHTRPNEEKKRLLDTVAAVAKKYSGVEWVETSWIRDSQGHRDGDSLDIAPAMRDARRTGLYSVARRSDPVLHMRPLIMGMALTASSVRWPFLGQLAALMALENDHLHLQIVIPKQATDACRIIAFQFGKDMTQRYPDSLARQHAAARMSLR